MGISREQLWALVGLVTPYAEVGVVTAVKESYDEVATRVWKGNLDSSPHGAPWHTSFHASEFPGVDEKACGRKAIYGLLDVAPAPFSMASRTIMDCGTDVERRIVSTLGRTRRLISGSVSLNGSPAAQARFEEPEVWLSGTLDSALDLRPDYPHVLPVDVKGKDHDKISLIQTGFQNPEAHYVRQVMVQTYFCRRDHEDMGWAAMGLQPARGASLLFVSRQRPAHMAEVFVPYQEEVIERGFDRLREWRDSFLQGDLPEKPEEFEYSKLPCKYCSFIKICKKDLKNGVTKIEDSCISEEGTKIYGEYDMQEKIDAVKERWMK